MAEFERHDQHAVQICREIERGLIGLGVDWHDEAQLRMLAREALVVGGNEALLSHIEDPIVRMTRLELYGLIGLMLRTMQESAELGTEAHGPESWKALARALWAEKSLLEDLPVSRGTG
jgi:hypothetical protein